MAPFVLILGGLILLYAVVTGKGRDLWEAILSEKFKAPQWSGGGQGGGGGGGGGSSGAISYNPSATQPLPGDPLPSGGDPLNGPLEVNTAPTISAAQIDRILGAAHSPAAGLGQQIYDLGVRYHINPAVALAFFQHETSLGTDYGNLNAGSNSWGNIRCGPGWHGACTSGGFRAYPSFAAAAEDWYRLIAGSTYVGGGLTTVDTIVPRYAPPFENDTPGYINQVKRLVRGWMHG